MKLISLLPLFACFVEANGKTIDINQVLRIQMKQLMHQYNSQKWNGHYGLKSKAELDTIKKELMNQFRKTAHETENKLGKIAKAMKVDRRKNRKS